MLLQLLSTVAPVMVIIGFGYVWARMRYAFDMETVGAIVLKIGSPALIFSTLTTLDIDLAAVGLTALAAMAVTAVCTVIGVVVLKLAKLPLHTHLLAVMTGNSGNMGLPVATLAFGEVGLALAIGYFAVVTVLQNTLGIAVSSGSFNPRTLLTQPIFYAVGVVVAVLLLDLPVPVWVSRTAEILGGFVIPSMLLLLGNALARLKVTDMKVAISVALLRLAAGVAGAFAIIWLFGLSGADAGVVFLMATMPVAVINVIFAERFRRNPELVAGVIVVSTLLVLAILPGLVWVALHIDDLGL